MAVLDEILERLSRMSPEDRAEAERLAMEGTAGMLWVPNPGPQTEAYFSPADELFYGGAAGGGKSDLLLGLAVNEHDRSVVFRRELKQTAAMADRLAAIRGTRAGWNGQERVCRMGDRLIEFGGCPAAGDEESWQGRPHDLKGFDEITQFLESQFRYLITWNRSTKEGQRSRVVATGNPPTTPEGEWVVKYWAPWLDPDHPNPAKPGEIRWFATMPDGKEVEVDGPDLIVVDGEEIQPRSRTFIPSSVDDNPFLARTNYKATLQGLPAELRDKFLHGDFQSGKDDHPMQVIPTAWIEAAMARWRPDGGFRVPMATIGGDVARGGKDETVLSPRHDNWFAPLVTAPGTSTPDGDSVVALILRVRKDGAVVHIDLTGVGTSPYDTLKRNKIQAVAFVAAGKSTARDQSKQLGFVNKRAESWWLMREALDPASGQDLALWPDRQTKADLASARYFLTPRGIQVEAKDDIKDRIGRSPDRGEAVILARYPFRKMAAEGQTFTAEADFSVLR
ncbi:MAG: terminase family protein [Rhodospirillales bacterium]|nr:terminase family protein [Rhodospirillales bacterium]